MDLVVIGSSNMDLVIYLPHIPKIGETVLGGKSATFFGGKGANQSVAAKRSGDNMIFITKIGKDIFGTDMLSHFKKEGFDTDAIFIDNIEATGVAQIFVSEKGENSIAVAPGANMTLSVDDINQHRQIIQNAKYVLIQLEISLKAVCHVIQMAYDCDTKVILNPAPAQKLSSELLKKVWLITPNETEAEILTSTPVASMNDAKKAIRLLLKKGVKNVIITLGDKGCVLGNSEEITEFKVFKETAIDTTAAGDVFNGVLAMALSKGKTFAKAISMASAAAAISVTKAGAQTSIPSLEEINNYLVSK